MMRLIAAIPLAFSACTPETTDFRTTDQSDPSDSDRAAYRLRVGDRGAARVQVWSNGGYIGSSDLPMTHIGFDIANTGGVPLVFDVDALRLTVEGSDRRRLPAPSFVAVTPLGPEKIAIPPGSSSQLDAYFELHSHPTEVQKMAVAWKLSAGSAYVAQQTSFVREPNVVIE